jgi:hypothetical protein
MVGELLRRVWIKGKEPLKHSAMTNPSILRDNAKGMTYINSPDDGQLRTREQNTQ